MTKNTLNVVKKVFVVKTFSNRTEELYKIYHEEIDGFVFYISTHFIKHHNVFSFFPREKQKKTH